MEPIPFLDLAALHDEVRPQLDEVWARTVDQSAFIGGSQVAAFEEQFATYCGRRFAVGVANGTDAIELTLRALGIGPGDEVIVPANTFYATVEAVHHVGAQPVFVDVDAETLLMTPGKTEPALSARTAAIIVVHLFGATVDLDAFAALAGRAGVALVEDAAQAHGARWQDEVAGSVGVAGCFSFYPGKNLGALGDGGAIVLDDPELARRLRSLSNHGRDDASPRGHSVVGRNSRLDGLQAGLLSTKLPRLDGWNERRRELWSLYEKGFAGSPVTPVTVDSNSTSVHHLAVVRVPARDEVRRRLTEAGVATGIHYAVPCHRLPPLGPRQHSPLAVAEEAAEQILSLPMFPQLGEERAHIVIERVLDAVSGVDQGAAGVG